MEKSGPSETDLGGRFSFPVYCDPDQSGWGVGIEARLCGFKE